MSEQTSFVDICIDENNVVEQNQEVLNYSPSTTSSLSDDQSKAVSDSKSDETQIANEDRNMTDNLRLSNNEVYIF